MAPTNAGTGWLSRWVDPDIRIPDGWGIAELADAEVERLLRSLTIILAASTFPRRLGGDAIGSELADDKRRCRRTAWAVKQALVQWTPTIVLPDKVSEEIRIEGAQLDWLPFGEHHLAVLTERTKRAATWAALNGEKKWGGVVVTRFENERRWMTHALR